MSAHPDIAEGERVWGFFPVGYAFEGTRAGKGKFAKFRGCLSPIVKDWPLFMRSLTEQRRIQFMEEAREDQDSLLRGLFMTSWLVEDFLEVNQFFGARKLPHYQCLEQDQHRFGALRQTARHAR